MSLDGERREMIVSDDSANNEVPQGDPITAVVVDEQWFDRGEFAAVCGVTLDWVSVHVEAGVFDVSGDVDTVMKVKRRDAPDQRVCRI
jgi:hypothetical protein